jgi:hypothetical protein
MKIKDGFFRIIPNSTKKTRIFFSLLSNIQNKNKQTYLITRSVPVFHKVTSFEIFLIFSLI